MSDDQIYLDRQRNVITSKQWARLSSDLSYKIVKSDTVGSEYLVITGWRGFDPYRTEPVNIFECVAFRRASESEFGHEVGHVEGRWSSDVNAHVDDSRTEAEALVQHEKLVQIMRQMPVRN